jgi:uncharacterized protein (DUF1501 family)
MITRRRFLQGVGAAGLAVGLERCAGGGGQAPTPRPAKPILVVIDIDGGNDWLNVMPPLTGSNRDAYAAARPTLGIAPAGIDDLGVGFGLNKDFYGMLELHTLGRVAWIPGIGMPNPNLSHFESIDLWGQGGPFSTGWLGRFADAAFSPTGDVLRGVTVTSDLPVMLRGADRSFVSITNGSGFVYPAALRSGRLSTSSWDTQAIEDAYGSAVGAPVDPAAPPGMTFAEAVGKQFFDAQNGFGINGTLNPRTPSVLYPGDAGHPANGLPGGVSASLGNQFKLIAQMLANGIDAEVFFTRIGGFDTHSNQLNDHPRLMRSVGAAVRSFYEDLGSVDTPFGNAMDRTLIIAYSEFGRRVPENNGGTDHGTAGLSFAVGRGVAGHVVSDYPKLNDLDRNGNMKHTVDFRSLYATVLERWLGLDPAAVDSVLGATYPRLDFL